MSIFILNIGIFIRHFPLQQQIPQISLLQKPLIKLTKSQLTTIQPLNITRLRNKQFRKMTWTSYQLHLSQIKCFTLTIITSILTHQFLCLLFIIFTDEFPDYFLCYVSANILIVVTSITNPLFLDRTKHSKSRTSLLFFNAFRPRKS